MLADRLRAGREAAIITKQWITDDEELAISVRSIAELEAGMRCKERGVVDALLGLMRRHPATDISVHSTSFMFPIQEYRFI